MGMGASVLRLLRFMEVGTCVLRLPLVHGSGNSHPEAPSNPWEWELVFSGSLWSIWVGSSVLRLPWSMRVGIRILRIPLVKDLVNSLSAPTVIVRIFVLSHLCHITSAQGLLYKGILPRSPGSSLPDSSPFVPKAQPPWLSPLVPKAQPPLTLTLVSQAPNSLVALFLGTSSLF